MSQPKVISLAYELRSDDARGEIIETATNSNPAQFLFGVGKLIPEFENQISHLNPGEAFEFIILADKAYGPVNQEAVVSLPKSTFVIDGKPATDMLELGVIISMTDQEGYSMNGKVLEVREETVIMDFNHPLAGVNLYFKGKVLDSREASSEEILHGHKHIGNDRH